MYLFRVLDHYQKDQWPGDRQELVEKENKF